MRLVLSVVLSFFFISTIFAQEQLSTRKGIVPLGEFVGADGTLKTPQGFSGSLDPKGWQLTTNPAGEPRFIPSFSSASTSSPADTAWSDQFSPLTTFDDAVMCMAQIGTDLYFGGNFKNINGIPIKYIAKWNGSSWSSLGTGTNAL